MEQVLMVPALESAATWTTGEGIRLQGRTEVVMVTAMEVWMSAVACNRTRLTHATANTDALVPHPRIPCWLTCSEHLRKKRGVLIVNRHRGAQNPSYRKKLGSPMTYVAHRCCCRTHRRTP